MKLLTGLKVLVRVTKNLDRIANALEGLLEVACKVHGVQATQRLPVSDAPDADPNDDSFVGYMTDADTAREQARQARRTREGWARDDGNFY